jgi:putative membrane protein
MALLLLKALHVIGFVAWFAGLFYLVRVLIYQTEALDSPQPERDILSKQFGLMAQRVYKAICNPAMMLTWGFGLAMLAMNTAYLQQPWMHVKLLLLALLTGYHLYCKGIMRKLAEGQRPLSSLGLRLLNEVATVFLVAIALVAVLGRNAPGERYYLYGLLGALVFGGLLYFAVKAANKKKA